MDAVTSQPQFEKKVTDYLRKSQALEMIDCVGRVCRSVARQP